MDILVVDTSVPFSELISRARIDWVHPDLTEQRFFRSNEGITSFNAHVVHPRARFHRRDLWKYAPRYWSEADFWRLLAYGAAFPGRLDQRPPIATQSVLFLGTRRYRSVPALYVEEGVRRLDAFMVGSGYTSGCRFLFTRKIIDYE